jgi:penicillin-binding protein 1A
MSDDSSRGGSAVRAGPPRPARGTPDPDETEDPDESHDPDQTDHPGETATPDPDDTPKPTSTSSRLLAVLAV